MGNTNPNQQDLETTNRETDFNSMSARGQSYIESLIDSYVSNNPINGFVTSHISYTPNCKFEPQIIFDYRATATLWHIIPISVVMRSSAGFDETEIAGQQFRFIDDDGNTMNFDYFEFNSSWLYRVPVKLDFGMFGNLQNNGVAKGGLFAITDDGFTPATGSIDVWVSAILVQPTV